MKALVARRSFVVGRFASHFIDIFRFDGEIAVPSGSILQRGTDLQWSKNKPAGKASIWRDVDGDGDKHHGPAFGVVTEKGQGKGG